jgi:tetratricopeptide (TPR) repeat protein
MRRLDKFRWLPAFAVLAALAAASPVLRAQTPVQAPPASALQSLPPQAGSQPQLTPEELGNSLMAHQRYQAAIDAYRSVPKKSADLWNKMGIAYQLMLNLNDATRCYKESLKMDSGSAKVYNNLGTVYDSLMQYRAAERMYRKALKLDPHSAVFHKNLGTAMLAQHQYKKGSQEYQAALAIDPHIFEAGSSPRVENPATLKERGAMNYFKAIGCARIGLNSQAIEYLRLALNEGFTNPKKVVADSQFAGLRGIPAFQQLLAEQSQRTQ